MKCRDPEVTPNKIAEMFPELVPSESEEAARNLTAYLNVAADINDQLEREDGGFWRSYCVSTISQTISHLFTSSFSPDGDTSDPGLKNDFYLF